MALDLAEQELSGAGQQPAAVKKIDLKAEMTKMAATKGGGAYIPPHRLRALLAEQEATDSQGAEYQRLSWEALRKSINGLINKVNVSNIKLLVPEVSPRRSQQHVATSELTPFGDSFSVTALRRELDSRPRSLCPFNHAGTSFFPSFLSHFRFSRRHR